MEELPEFKTVGLTIKIKFEDHVTEKMADGAMSHLRWVLFFDSTIRDFTITKEEAKK